jgi:hypothetical protein
LVVAALLHVLFLPPSLHTLDPTGAASPQLHSVRLELPANHRSSLASLVTPSHLAYVPSFHARCAALIPTPRLLPSRPPFPSFSPISLSSPHSHALSLTQTPTSPVSLPLFLPLLSPFLPHIFAQEEEDNTLSPPITPSPSLSRLEAFTSSRSYTRQPPAPISISSSISFRCCLALVLSRRSSPSLSTLGGTRPTCFAGPTPSATVEGPHHHRPHPHPRPRTPPVPSAHAPLHSPLTKKTGANLFTSAAAITLAQGSGASPLFLSLAAWNHSGSPFCATVANILILPRALLRGCSCFDYWATIPGEVKRRLMPRSPLSSTPQNITTCPRHAMRSRLPLRRRRP